VSEVEAANLWPFFLSFITDCKMHFFAFMGALALYVMNRLNNRQPFSLLKAMNYDVSNTGKPRVVFADMCLSSVLGAVIIVPMTTPSTINQAIVAGLGLTGILSAYSKSNDGEEK